MKKQDDTAAVVARLRKSEIKAVKKAAAKADMTLSAYVRHCVQIVGGFQWPPLVARGKYQRKSKQEGNDDNTVR